MVLMCMQMLFLSYCCNGTIPSSANITVNGSRFILPLLPDWQQTWGARYARPESGGLAHIGKHM
jgi:hypothetical protein